MADALSIALSGLKAQGQKLAVAASNIANVSTTGRLPDSPEQAAASAVYKPLQVNFISDGAGGGVRTSVTEKANGYSAAYDPSSIYANSDGLVAAPNVDFVEEAVNIIETKTAFKANVSVIKTQDELLGELLDTLA